MTREPRLVKSGVSATWSLPGRRRKLPAFLFLPLPLEREDNLDLGIDLDGRAVEKHGLIPPLTHGRNGRFRERANSVHVADMGNASVLVNNRMDFDDALDPFMSGGFRIVGLKPVDESGGLNRCANHDARG